MGVWKIHIKGGGVILSGEAIEPFDFDRIAEKYGVTNRLMKSARIGVADLAAIYNDYADRYAGICEVRSELAQVFDGYFFGDGATQGVHSLRSRAKDPEHVVEKIIRNRHANWNKYKRLDKTNYYKLLTDLVGLRVLLFNRTDWKTVHTVMLEHFDVLERGFASSAEDLILSYDECESRCDELVSAEATKLGYLIERPVAYVTSPLDRTLYKGSGIRIQDSKERYRSVHYIGCYKGVFFELQVRTVFEEAWLEFSHSVLYPYDLINAKKNAYVRILKDAATVADGLVMFYDGDDFQRQINTADEGIATVQSLANSATAGLSSTELNANTLNDLLIAYY